MVPIYYGDILSTFMSKGGRSRIVFKADAISTPERRLGLHELKLAGNGR